MILRSAADGRRHERPRLRARSPRLRPLLPPAGSLGGSSPVGPTEPPTPLRTARSERPGSYLGQASSRHRTAPARPSTALSSESGTELRRSPPEQPDGIRPRRPAGTAELPADAAPTRRGQGREERSAGGAAPRRSVRKWTAAAAVLVVGIGLVVIALNSVVDHGSRNPLNISASRTTLAAAHAGDIGLDLRRTIGNTAAEVRALAGSVRPHARTAPPRRDTHPRAHRQTHPVGRDEAAHATRTTLGAAPPSERTQPTVTQSPVAPPESTAHQPVVTSHSSSSTSSSQPTGNNSATSLFGGIGSCVKGCS